MNHCYSLAKIYFCRGQIVHVEILETIVNHTYSPNGTANYTQSHIFYSLAQIHTYNRKDSLITHQIIIKPQVQQQMIIGAIRDHNLLRTAAYLVPAYCSTIGLLDVYLDV